MNILIDTNIFIYFEDFKVLDDSYTNLFNILNKYNHNMFIHPSSLEDISKDKDMLRQQISMSKIKKYTILDRPPIPSEKELIVLGLNENVDNDRIDNLILYALYKDSVNILLTEDIGIIKKARQLGIDHRVMYVQQALNTFRQLHLHDQVSYPEMIKKYIYQLDITDNIFNSLKEDYSEFLEWFKKISQERRECWIHSYPGTDKIGGILIYKEETDPIVTSDRKGLPGKVLKISTFKISEYMQGLKLGELFIKTIFGYTNKNNYNYLYLTTRSDKQEYLISLIEDFGFTYYGKCDKERDDVYIKQIGKISENSKSGTNKLEFYKKYSPSILCGGDTNKFIVPIQPNYHNILFPELEDQKRLFYTHASVGNTIKKAYLSHANTKDMRSGDLVLFYRSQDKKAITTLGIVEKMFISSELDVILEEVAKRTVYSYDEIKKMSNKKTHIILFRLIDHFPEPFVTKEWLEEKRIYKKCQSICKIEDNVFNKILEKGRLTYCVKY
jgi:rRNA-processing protein FCF1